MSYAAEPYEVFVDDLLGSFTGAVSRLRFTFLASEAPFELGDGNEPVPESLRVHGLVGATFHRFVIGVDYVVVDNTIVWRESSPGVPDGAATWPDDGSDFWVAFEQQPGNGEPPVLTDRNEGSITRTLAESMAIEFAVVAHQLEGVYEAAHVGTATGRDLDRVAELVGVKRRGKLHARGAVTLRRSSPAPADITIAAGTRISTGDTPLVTVETNETVTLRRGTIAVNAPVRALADGAAGVAAANTLVVLHRPILGVEDVVNTQSLTFGGGAESDEAMRRRIGRALETSGRSTVGAIKGALASIDAIREQDILVEEDHLAFPGAVKVVVATDLDEADALAASRVLEDVRPAGIRIVHDLPSPSATPPIVGTADDGGGGDDLGDGDGPTAAPEVVGSHDFPIAIKAVVTPASTELVDLERSALVDHVVSAIVEYVDAASIGQSVVYNGIVFDVMGVDGVLDVVLDLAPRGNGAEPDGRKNLRPPTNTRATLDRTDLEVILGGALIALDITATVELLGEATSDQATAIQNAQTDIASRLRLALQTPPAKITPSDLLGKLPNTDDYHVAAVQYTAELLEEGLIVERVDVPLELSGSKQPWVRQVSVVLASTGAA